MKEYKYLYKQMLDKDLVRRAYKKLRKGKTKRKEIIAIDADLDSEVDKMYETILNTKPCEVEHPELAYKPIHHKAKHIFEHGKERKIYMPEIHEQWLHHIIVKVLEPIIFATAHPYTCGSLPKRGAHYGKRYIEKWVKDARYFAKCDIRHFYGNIHHDILKRELERHIKDEWFIYIVMLCLSQFKKGLPLGYYISQWLANYLLEPLDYMISSDYPKYMRYMDDIVFFGNNKKRLRQKLTDVKIFLGRYRLRLKTNYQVAKYIYKGKGRCLDFMGFMFFPERTIMRKNILFKATRLARRLFRVEKYPLQWLQAMMSYMGWFSNTDTYAWYWLNVKPYVNIRTIKKIISRRSKHEEMATRNLLVSTI